MPKPTSSHGFEESAGFLEGLLKQGRLSWRLLRDGRVPGWVKLIPVAGLLYLLSPVDIVPDFLLPGLGEIDDIVLLLLAAKVFVDLSPPHVVSEHLADLFGGPRRSPRHEEGNTHYVDAPYHVIDDEE
ncbi:MAG: DUF1232 domain-containing protein [Anaerolineae bacterium]